MVEEHPAGNKLTGFYRGIVIQHCTHGYCKIWIPSVYADSQKDAPETLPIAEQASGIFGGTNAGSGVFSYPNIGSIVWCFFANGDQNYPVYFAVTLGGQNAFGQYETIKTQNELCSTSHLITSGKTHVELFERGCLSVRVEDPDRRDAEVRYNNYLSQISTDHVTARPIVDRVDTEELSNIHCQLVLDNNDTTNGSIYATTHWFDKQNITDVNTQSSRITELTTDSGIWSDNSGDIGLEILSAGTLNTIDGQAGSSYTANINASTIRAQNINGTISDHANTSITTIDTHGSNSTTIIKNHMLNDIKSFDRGIDNSVIIDYSKTEQQGTTAKLSTVKSQVIAQFNNNETGAANQNINIKSNVITDNIITVDSECIDTMNTVSVRAERKITNKLAEKKCENKIILDSTSGELEVVITDQNTNKKCSLLMKKDGTAILYCDTSLTIKCPTISMAGVNGDTAVTVTGTLNVTGQIDGGADIVAGADCKASNCTLNTHVHTNPAGGLTGVGQSQ